MKNLELMTSNEQITIKVFHWNSQYEVQINGKNEHMILLERQQKLYKWPSQQLDTKGMNWPAQHHQKALKTTDDI